MKTSCRPCLDNEYADQGTFPDCTLCRTCFTKASCKWHKISIFLRIFISFEKKTQKMTLRKTIWTLSKDDRGTESQLGTLKLNKLHTLCTIHKEVFSNNSAMSANKTIIRFQFGFYNISGPCMGDPCFTSVGCHNLGNDSFECESCPDGFEGDGIICTDINEVRWKSSGFGKLIYPTGFAYHNKNNNNRYLFIPRKSTLVWNAP